MTNLIEFTKEYHSLGMIPIPVYAKNKQPKGTKWQNTTREMFNENAFAADDNVGILLGVPLILRLKHRSLRNLYRTLCVTMHRWSPICTVF